jgi:hypothetical protein
MAIPGRNAELIRRFKLYGFGFLLGLLVVSFIYKGRGCQLPSTTKLEELSYQRLEYTRHGACRMACRGITEQEIKALLKTGKINYDKSNVHDQPCGTYAVEGATKDGQQVRIVIADCDTISKVVTAIDLKLDKDTCSCK